MGLCDNMDIFTKFHQKNDQGGLDGNGESLNISCPRDKEHQGAYDDIISYLSKRPTPCITKEFYLQVNSSNSG